MKNKSLVSISDFSKSDYLKIISTAEEFDKNSYQNILDGKVIGTLFFEPSTRTRLSFESSINRLGGKVVGFTDASSSSVTKGESLYDTIQVVQNYCELIVMRHPLEGSARFASEICNVPIVNAGDGANQHPTQTLLDLYTIKQSQGTLENLDLFMVGDLKYGRTVHSLLMAMSEFNTRFHFISPEELKMPEVYKIHLQKKGLEFTEYRDIDDNVNKADILYMTRVQKERFSDPIEYERTKNAYILKADMISKAKNSMKVLHPLPRVNEIDVSVDTTEHANYFKQAENGVYVRQAIISLILGIKN